MKLSVNLMVANSRCRTTYTTTTSNKLPKFFPFSMFKSFRVFINLWSMRFTPLSCIRIQLTFIFFIIFLSFSFKLFLMFLPIFLIISLMKFLSFFRIIPWPFPYHNSFPKIFLLRYKKGLLFKPFGIIQILT